MYEISDFIFILFYFIFKFNKIDTTMKMVKTRLSILAITGRKLHFTLYKRGREGKEGKEVKYLNHHFKKI